MHNKDKTKLPLIFICTPSHQAGSAVAHATHWPHIPGGQQRLGVYFLYKPTQTRIFLYYISCTKLRQAFLKLQINIFLITHEIYVIHTIQLFYLSCVHTQTACSCENLNTNQKCLRFTKPHNSVYNIGNCLQEEDDMFNIGFAELLLILLIAFVVVGPKDLPKVARALGRFVRYIRNMIEEVKRESGLDEVEKELKNIERKVDEGVRAVDIRPDLQKTQLQINKELNAIKKDVSFKDFKSNLGGKKS